MDENSRVHPECINSANPYHECGVSCLEKISNGEKRKDKKKIDKRNSFQSKKKDDERRVNESCARASNPYHVCDELCSNRTSLADALRVKKESDNRNGIKRGELSKKKDGEKTLYPTCAKAANPYHERDEFCSKGTTLSNARAVKKDSDIRNGVKQDEVSKKKDAGKTVYPSCTRSSNPYHECDENCLNRNTEANNLDFKKETGSKFLEASRSFGKKKKGSDSQPRSPGVLVNNQTDPKSPRSHFSRKKVELENGGSFTSSEIQSEGRYSREQSLDKDQVQPAQSVPASGNLTAFYETTQTRVKEIEEVIAPSQVGSDRVFEYGRDGTNSSTFSFTGVARAVEEESDDEEVESVISDSCVSVGKYHVRASVSSTLQAIFDKYGDIAANCQLESASMRAYYLECLCSVVQELHSTAFQQLTKAKLKEMFAVLKDVESAHIDVTWLRAILNEILEAIELVSQRHAIEATKTSHERSLESTRKQLESQMEDLARKEKDAADARARVAEMEAKMKVLELECSRLDKTVSSIRSAVDKFHGKTLTDQLL